MSNIPCPHCEQELTHHDTWWHYETPYSRRLTSEKPIYGSIYKCRNEECEQSFYTMSEDDDELHEGYPC